jgi:PIN domain nuclease of toxin-antitoxin system
MKNLVDTHAVLWFLNGEQMSKKSLNLIINGEYYVSIVSLWEVAIKMSIGKYTFDGGFSEFLRLVEDNGFRILPIKNEYMLSVFSLPFHHKDPFDRLLIATAISEGLTIITADENIQKYDVGWIW